MNNVTLELISPSGEVVKTTSPDSVEYTNVLGAIGYAEIKVSTSRAGNFPKGKARADDLTTAFPFTRYLPSNLYDWRVIIKYAGRVDFIGVIRRVTYGTNEQGGSYADLTVADLNILFDSRVVAYREGSAQANKTGAADDLIKAYVRENVGSLSTTDYSGATITTRDASAWLTVAGDQSAAVSVEWKASGAGLLDTMQELQKAAIAGGSNLVWGITYQAEKAVLVTGLGFVGVDRTPTAVFSLENGNLRNPRLVYDYMAYNTIAYAADAGKEAEQVIVESTNPNISLRSIASRREAWVNSSGETTDELTADGQSEVMSAYPRLRFEGEIISNQRTPYSAPTNSSNGQSSETKFVGTGGLVRNSGSWKLGDLVSVNFAGQTFRVLVKAVNVRVDQRTGDTLIRARIESTQAVN
jgi:hypothetical protein